MASVTSVTRGVYNIINKILRLHARVKADMNRIDAAIAVQFKDEMWAKIDEIAHHVVLDLKRVNFIDSSGLGETIGCR